MFEHQKLTAPEMLMLWTSNSACMPKRQSRHDPWKICENRVWPHKFLGVKSIF